MSFRGERWLLIAASSRGIAEEYAARRGIDAVMVLDRRELFTAPWRLRKRLSSTAVDRAAIHSVNWARERTPQLAELALSVAPVEDRLLIDEATGTVERGGALLGPLAAARIPLEALAAGALTGREVLRLLRAPSAPPAPRGLDAPRVVLAIWPFATSSVGGAVTHMSGILGGFKRVGVKVGLASAGPVPEQLAAVADEIDIAPPLPRRNRVSGDTEQIAVNRGLLASGRRLAARIGADFVYQRHSAFLDAGARIASALDRPFVLEWNASEVWKRRNWDRAPLSLPLMERLAASVERRALTAATIVAAVSTRAATMAIEAGGVPERVRVVPNGVDVTKVDWALEQAPAPSRGAAPLIGWIGSFGPWHGASVLVRAVPHLPPEANVRMIGDGRERPSLQALASELGVADRIEWAGALPHGEALASLARCDVLASPHVPAGKSPFFGSPTKLFEYMALGRPIVASGLEQIGEVLQHERTALLVEPGDERDLATAISRLLADPGQAAALGGAAGREARARHTWDRRAASLVEALEGDS